ncbi:hypothetical protein [uncultured Pelagimonas sp.]|uniref:hypothetical protein n=1 Tax=uncultured Pelagimonas sp. TaxID=1618102 RepID=UPI0026198E72|nr:hypothetical protein [uncultured Pelagimonas sp.]
MIRIGLVFLFLFVAAAKAQEALPINAWPGLDHVEARNLRPAEFEKLVDKARLRINLRRGRQIQTEIDALEKMQAQVLMPAADTAFIPELRAHVKEYRIACSQGDTQACTELGLFYFYGAGVWIDKELGKAMVELSCHRGGLAACESGFRFEDYGPHEPILTRGCMNGSAQSCYTLAYAYGNGRVGLAKDTNLASTLNDMALDLARVGCRKGNGQNCFLQYNILESRYRYQKDPIPEAVKQELVQALNAGCALRNPNSCGAKEVKTQFNSMKLELGTPIPHEPIFDDPMHPDDLACTLGHQSACRSRHQPLPRYSAFYNCNDIYNLHLCRSYMPGQLPDLADGRDDLERMQSENREGRALFEAATQSPEYFMFHPKDYGKLRRVSRSCVLGQAYACRNLAEMYEGGFGTGLWLSDDYGDIVSGLQEKRSLLLHLCDAGDALACHEFGYSHTGRGDEDRPDLYMRAWQRACDMGAGHSCQRLAFEYGLEQSSDEDELLNEQVRIRYAKRACDLDVFDGCRELNGYGNADPTQYPQLNLRACLEGVGASCEILAQEYRAGSDGFRKDRAFAKLILKAGISLTQH